MAYYFYFGSRRAKYVVEYFLHSSLGYSSNAKANDGEGPDILRSVLDGGTSGHAESLAATLAEHQQHLSSFQLHLDDGLMLLNMLGISELLVILHILHGSKFLGLIDQLNEVVPTIQNSISECTEKVNNVSSSQPPMAKHCGRATSPIQAQSSGRTLETSSDNVVEVTSKISTVQLDKVSASPPALKLPQLFSLTPNSSGKGANLQKRQMLASQTIQMENLSERNSLDKPLSNNRLDNPSQDGDNFIQNLKRSVREAALSMQSCNSESSHEIQSDESSEHFFLRLSSPGFSLIPESKAVSTRSKRISASQMNSAFFEKHAQDGHAGSKYNELPEILNDLGPLTDYDHVNGFLSVAGSNGAISDGQRSFNDVEDPYAQVFSPPLLLDTSLLPDSYEDLLAPLSETETALMEL
ncbi:AUGMIN SUBUNIT 6-LIKE [Salix purpurea]|uniref:AUGMIN SUBUNIT 6-LIKE n=1 Tax=Salix purpurea TaxID=77065 RepID=A0A9Q1A156_SALPP|nr:AUGMIN SUBUNIT 6-LIKE [Salix purpurea]